MRLSEFFQGRGGKLSSTRLLLLVWGFGVLGVWIYTVINTKTLATNIDPQVVWILGSLLAASVGKSFVDSNKTISPKE